MMRYFLFALMVWAVSAATAGRALAAEVTMRLRGSDLTFPGTVLNFDGVTYSLDTELFGKVDLDTKKYECIAGACSVTNAVSNNAVGPDFELHGSSSVGLILMPLLIGGYAKSIEASATLLPSNDITELKIELADLQGAKLANIDMRTDGSSTAFPALAEGKATIGMSSRQINKAEAEVLPSVREHFLARDGLTVIVSPKNPMSEISTEQLAGVFTGTISDWSEIGQPPGKINVYARNKGSGALDTFSSSMLNVASDQITPDAQHFVSEAALSQAVAGDPLGIGFTSFASRANTKAVAISTVCGITYSPSVFDIKVQEYPFTRDLLLYRNPNQSAEHAQGLINYALSDQAQTIISGAGFINRSWAYLSFQNQGNRITKSLDTSSDSFDLKLMKKLIKEVGKLSRLSVSFRFRTASFALDAQSQSKIQQLVALLSTDQVRDKQILLLGFSDAVGAFDKNRELSAIRARAVKQEILNVSDGRINAARLKTRGYGELLPVGCNDDPLGRAQNRRVEVWIEAPATPAAQVSATATPAAQINAAAAPAAQINAAATPAAQSDDVAAPAIASQTNALAAQPPADNPASPTSNFDRQERLFRKSLDWRGDITN